MWQGFSSGSSIRRYLLKLPPLYRIFDLNEQGYRSNVFPGFVCETNPKPTRSRLFLKSS